MDFNGISTEHMIYGTLFSLCNRIQTIGDSTFKEITMKQHFLLIGLGLFEEPPTLNELSHVIGSSYQNVKRMLVALEKRGYVKLVQDEKDKRKSRVVMQPKVQEFVGESREISDQFMGQLYDGIKKEDLKVALQVLVKMENNLGGFVDLKSDQ